MEPDSILDYEKLVSEYWGNLTTTLRGFRPTAEFLDMWVPDEDALKSILNLIEAAQMASQDQLSTYLGPDTLKSLDLDKLTELARQLGSVQIEPDHNGVVLTVSHLQDWQAFQRVHPAYRSHLEAAAQLNTYTSVLEPSPGLELVQATIQNLTLTVLVDRSDHTIQKAAYQGSGSPVEQGLLEALCGLLLGMTIQEASDHAAIYLEFQLRDRTQTPPVQGIVTPQNVDPIFQLPLQLTRQLLAQYRQLTGYSATENTFDRSPSPAWLVLTPEEKMQKVQNFLHTACAELSLQPNDIEVVHIDDAVKVTVAIRVNWPSAQKQRYLMQLETRLKQQIDNKLQLYLEELKDLNAIRRL